MKRLLSFVAAMSLAIGGILLSGCQQGASPQSMHHDEQFGGGSGEFGTTPAIAGDYPQDVRHQQVTNAGD